MSGGGGSGRRSEWGCWSSASLAICSIVMAVVIRRWIAGLAMYGGQGVAGLLWLCIEPSDGDEQESVVKRFGMPIDADVGDSGWWWL